MRSQRVDFFPLRGPAMCASDPGWLYDNAVRYMEDGHRRYIKKYLGAQCLFGAKVTPSTVQLHGFVVEEGAKKFTVESHYAYPNAYDLGTYTNLKARHDQDGDCENIVLTATGAPIQHTHLHSGLALPEMFKGNAYHQFEERTRRLDVHRSKPDKLLMTDAHQVNGVIIDFLEEHGHAMHHPALQQYAMDVIYEEHRVR